MVYSSNIYLIVVTRNDFVFEEGMHIYWQALIGMLGIKCFFIIIVPNDQKQH